MIIDIELVKDEVLETDFSIGTKIGTSYYPEYQGEYEIIPHPYDEQILPTRRTSVLDNIKVEKIPYSEVSNPQGGYTVNIGGL